jgi:hypothetical protein
MTERKKPRPSGGQETNAQRQAELRRRRKADGWRYLPLWLTPERAAVADLIGAGDARRGINLALDRMGRSGKYDEG